jgi:hypothetical protein
MVTFLAYRHYSALAVRFREQFQAPTVEQVGALPSRDKNFAIGNDAVSLPSRERTASPLCG